MLTCGLSKFAELVTLCKKYYGIGWRNSATLWNTNVSLTNLKTFLNSIHIIIIRGMQIGSTCNFKFRDAGIRSLRLMWLCNFQITTFRITRLVSHNEKFGIHERHQRPIYWVSSEWSRSTFEASILNGITAVHALYTEFWNSSCYFSFKPFDSWLW